MNHISIYTNKVLDFIFGECPNAAHQISKQASVQKEREDRAQGGQTAEAIIGDCIRNAKKSQAKSEENLKPHLWLRTDFTGTRWRCASPGIFEFGADPMSAYMAWRREFTKSDRSWWSE